jgi:L-rhamnose mutarotase
MPEKQRVAFQLQLRPGMGEAYDQSHQAVWPEMLELLKRSGVSEYSIFRRDETLILVMEVDNFEATWTQIEADPINTRWQEAMAPLFAPLPNRLPGERFPMLKEVFYLP